jgi:hypothetical protein
MKKFLPLLLLAGVVLLLAQAQRDQKGAQPSGTDNQTTIQGCLSGSGGNYTLTDSWGHTFQLAGDTDKLNEHVGHKVEVAGTSSGDSPDSSKDASPPSSGTSSSQPTVNVSSVKHIADSCDTGR